jgi:hypothetical protein
MAVLLVGGLGIFGNVLIILLAVKYTVRKNIHYLIVNMAISDVLVVFVDSTEILLRLFTYNIWDHDGGIAAQIYCKMINFSLCAFPLATLESLAVISIERFRATRLTALRTRPYTLTQRIAVLSASWLISIVLSAFYLYHSEYIDQLGCTLRLSNSLILSFTIMYICVFIWFCLVVLLSILTSLRLSKTGEIQTNLSDEQRQLRTKRIANAVRMVMCSLLLYTCCYLPFFLFYLLFFFVFRGFNLFLYCFLWNQDLEFIVKFLPLVNSCLSPFVYIVFMIDFREAAKNLVFRNTSIDPQ